MVWLSSGVWALTSAVLDGAVLEGAECLVGDCSAGGGPERDLAFLYAAMGPDPWVDACLERLIRDRLCWVAGFRN